ncbi:alpha/beta hydrolase [Cohnella faecalis]|nr:alpha/beta hydrolase-fold protein [Cohnella faecalis]
MESKIITLSNVYSKNLNNVRDIFVYLPPSYDISITDRYPVLYAHDGQHIFAADHKGGSWNVHATVDRLSRESLMREIIVVAVSSISDQRVSEYFHDNPGVSETFHAKCSGEVYERFLVEEVKPLIDNTFRTLPDRDNTAIIGSSAGGLVSYHIGFRRPDVFGHVGILSPFFVHTVVKEAESALEQNEDPISKLPIYEKFSTKPPIRIWLDIGGAEGLLMVEDVREAADRLVDQGFKPGNDLMFLLDPEAGHTQQDWANRMASPLLYFFGRIGKPASLEMLGRRKIGLNGRSACLYPNVTYDSGFRTSLLEAEYSVDRPEILSIASDGRVTPLSIGEAKITVRFGGLEHSVGIEVVQELSDRVEIEFSVEVPPSTPVNAPIHAGLEIPKKKDGLYQGRFQLPRDLIFDVKVSRGFGFHEKRGSSRRFSTSESQSLHFVVEEWEPDELD